MFNFILVAFRMKNKSTCNKMLVSEISTRNTGKPLAFCEYASAKFEPWIYLPRKTIRFCLASCTKYVYL
jgi:hypothetical protein